MATRGRPRKVATGDQPVAASIVVPDAPAQKAGDVQDTQTIPAYHREHPEKLSGQALRDLAYRKGMAKSELATMPDEKIRLQIRYIDYRRAAEEAGA